MDSLNRMVRRLDLHQGPGPGVVGRGRPVGGPAAGIPAWYVTLRGCRVC